MRCGQRRHRRRVLGYGDARRSPRNGRRLDGVRLLLVEDHADTREIYGRVLAAQGATVTAASRADAAAEVLGIVDIVATDVSMPDDDGVWLLEHVRATAPSVPVIGISGFTKEQLPESAAAFDLLLLKPVDPWDLVENIARVLQDRPRRTG